MKKWIFLLLFQLFFKSIKAQNKFTPFVNVNGSSLYANAETMQWSMGETVFTNTLIHPSGFILTGGWIQPNINNNFIKNKNKVDIQFILGPNPTPDFINIYCNQLGVMIESIQITDAFGQPKEMLKGPFSGVHFNLRIPFISANTGIYFILVHYIVDMKLTESKTYKIIKI
jgi:hypothetical protein